MGDLNEIETLVKSMIIPYKDGASIQNISSDYKELVGEQLPFYNFGFKNPRDFLASMKGLESGCNRFGEIIFRARLNKDTVHIQKLVSSQKTCTKKRKKPVRRAVLTNNYWRPVQQSYHNRQLSRASGAMNTRSFARQQQQQQQQQQPLQSKVLQTSKPSSKPLLGPANKARASTPYLSASDIENIKELLKKYENGISMKLFSALYEKKFGEPLNPHARGFSDLQHALSSISHICKVDLDQSRKFYTVKLVDPPLKKTNKNESNTATPSTHRKIIMNDNDMRIEVSPINDALDKIPKSTIVHFKTILNKYPYGVPAATFVKEYEVLSRASMETSSWGYSCPMDLFYGLPSLFFVDPADARSDKKQDAIIYDTKKVPSEVRSRVSAYNKKKEKPGENDLWLLKIKIMALMMNDNNGLSVENFSTEYYINFNEGLDPCKYNFKDYHDMFEQFSKELPIELCRNFAGDETKVQLVANWEFKWTDYCIKYSKYDALKALIVPENVLLPGDVIPEVKIDDKTIGQNVWEPIILTSVVNPSCIFVNLFGKYFSEALDAIMSELVFYSTSQCVGYEVPSFCLRENLFCVAPFDADKCWHRVKVVKVDPELKFVKVAFIDFGGEQIIASSKLRLMKKEYGHLPSQAIRISLRGIRPKDEKWPSNAKIEILSFMDRAIVNKEDILCRFNSQQPLQGKRAIKFDADVCAKTSVGYNFLHKQLIESGTAIIDEISNDKNQVLIPNNDIHRPLRKTRRPAGNMIAKLRTLQAKKLQTNGESNNDSQATGTSSNSEVDNLHKKMEKLAV